MKKIISFIFSFILLLSLASCDFLDKKEMTIKFETNGGTTINNVILSKDDISLFELPETTKEGFNFEGWYLDNDLKEIYNKEALTKALSKGEITLYASWLEQRNSHVMSYDEYLAAELDSEVVVETYVQAKQSWWDNKGTFYTQNEEGAYFIYNMAVTEEEYNKLTPGTKIRVEGYKAAWSGEVEIINAKYTILEGNFIATAEDVTSLLGTEGLVNKQNILAAFKGLEVTKEATYKADGSGKEGDDLYFGVRVNGNEYTFTVESYLCSKDTEVYQTVKSLKLGDIVDLEGFLYWYEGANPHITKATVLEKASEVSKEWKLQGSDNTLFVFEDDKVSYLKDGSTYDVEMNSDNGLIKLLVKTPENEEYIGAMVNGAFIVYSPNQNETSVYYNESLMSFELPKIDTSMVKGEFSFSHTIAALLNEKELLNDGEVNFRFDVNGKLENLDLENLSNTKLSLNILLNLEANGAFQSDEGYTNIPNLNYELYISLQDGKLFAELPTEIFALITKSDLSMLQVDTLKIKVDLLKLLADAKSVIPSNDDMKKAYIEKINALVNELNTNKEVPSFDLSSFEDNLINILPQSAELDGAQVFSYTNELLTNLVNTVVEALEENKDIVSEEDLPNYNKVVEIITMIPNVLNINDLKATFKTLEKSFESSFITDLNLDLSLLFKTEFNLHFTSNKVITIEGNDAKVDKFFETPDVLDVTSTIEEAVKAVIKDIRN